MPAGRNQAAFDDINYDGVSLPIDGVTITYDETQPNGIPAALTGRAVSVTVTGGRVVAKLAADGESVHGRLMRITRDLFCAMAHRGFVPLPAGASATITPGRKVVGALGGAGGTQPGYIRDAASGTAVELARKGGHAYDNTDLNNVLVDLG